MSETARQAQLLSWDTNHFGLRMARFAPENVSDIQTAVDWSRDQGVKFLMARCDTSNVAVVHELQHHMFLLMDTFVHYTFSFAKKTIPVDSGVIPIRPFQPDDIPKIHDVARDSFKGYVGHFHSDPRLDRETCDSVYSEWAVNSCRDRNLADEVLVADRDGDLQGFATLKVLNAVSVEGALFGVAPKAQGLGIYRSFMVRGMQWCLERGFGEMEVGTQVNNYAVQRVWQRLGFEIQTSGHTFHLWLND